MKNIRRTQIDMLDILRVCATLFVFLLHGRGYIEGIDNNDSLLSKWSFFPAWGGVWIFFFLSGYLFGKNMMQNKYLILVKDSINIKFLFKYYLSRIIRLVPIYLLYCLLFDLFNNGILIYDNPYVFIRIITLTFNGVNGFVGVGHLWYISTAMQLYLIMPFIYLLLR